MKKIALVALLLTSWCCSKYNLSGPSNDMEHWMVQTIEGRCREIGVVPVEVQFTNDKRDVEKPNGQVVPAAMWAYGEEDRIVVWRPVLDLWDAQRLDQGAKHECCHCLLDHQNYKDHPNAELEADTCVKERWP